MLAQSTQKNQPLPLGGATVFIGRFPPTNIERNVNSSPNRQPEANQTDTTMAILRRVPVGVIWEQFTLPAGIRYNAKSVYSRIQIAIKRTHTHTLSAPLKRDHVDNRFSINISIQK